jgi:hypothetical protein
MGAKDAVLNENILARGGAFRLEAKGIVTGVDLAIANQNILGGVDI